MAGAAIGRITSGSLKERKDGKELLTATLQAVWGSPAVVIDGREIKPKVEGLVQIVSMQTEILNGLRLSLEKHTDDPDVHGPPPLPK